MRLTMLPQSLVVILLVFVFSDVNGEGEACECYMASDISDDESVVARVLTDRVSFVVPIGARHCQMDSPDSENRRWVTPNVRVLYSWSPFGRRNMPLFEDQCKVLTPYGEGVLTKVDDSDAFVFRIPDVDGRVSGDHIVSVKASSVDDSCLWINRIIQEFEFINHWEKIRVVYVHNDHSFFVYENEVQLLEVAGVGDLITRNGGRVTRIDDKAIEVEEWIPVSADAYLDKVSVIRQIKVHGFPE